MENNTESVSEEIIEVESHDCVNCGSSMKFDPKTNSLKCDYCEYLIPLNKEEVEIVEKDFFEAIKNNKGYTQSVEDNSVNEIECKNCGAKLLYDNTVVTKECPYCHSKHIIKVENDIFIKPGYLIPFAIEKDEVNSKFKSWLKAKFFAVKNIDYNNVINQVNGVYIPCWTYDMHSYSSYTAERGTYYYTTVTRRVNGKTVTERKRKIRWRNVSGVYDTFHDDILIDASKVQATPVKNVMKSFDLKKLEAYDNRYILGFIAKRYEIDIEEGFNMAKEDASHVISRGIENQVGGDRVRNIRFNPSYNDIKFKHLLLPIWNIGYKYKNKDYYFVMNGQTGQFEGSYPKDVKKIIFTILAVLLFCLVFTLVTNYFDI